MSCARRTSRCGPPRSPRTEDRFIISWRWWPLADLAATEEVVYPVDLARLVARWLADGPPPGPAPIR